MRIARRAGGGVVGGTAAAGALALFVAPGGRVRGAAAASALALLAACGGNEPDAWGSFEADEVVVSAEVGGRLLSFDASEGSRLASGAVVATVDTTATALQIDELEARRAAATSQTGASRANVAALEAELAAAAREHSRTQRLFAAEAATARQLEQAAARVEVLTEQIRAAREQTASTSNQGEVVTAQLAQLRDRLDRSQVRNPIAGTVLTTYASAGEFVQPGQPLYRIADLDTLILRAYVSGAQLSAVRLGAPAIVQFDLSDGELGRREGVITWVASEAEFTPTPIQTREERTELVYAVEVAVPNPDGALKVGMPGELVLTDADGDGEGR